MWRLSIYFLLLAEACFFPLLFVFEKNLASWLKRAPHPNISSLPLSLLLALGAKLCRLRPPLFHCTTSKALAHEKYYRLKKTRKITREKKAKKFTENSLKNIQSRESEDIVYGAFRNEFSHKNPLLVPFFLSEKKVAKICLENCWNNTSIIHFYQLAEKTLVLNIIDLIISGYLSNKRFWTWK